jgi:hypothetical protein
MVNLLTEAAPCLILLDETLEYLNKALGMRAHDGNLAATTLTVIKELCTAASNVRGAAIIATLTSSRLEDYATVAGEEMQERLSKVVGRTENIVTPVEGADIFPILHTRLFESIGDHSGHRAGVPERVRLGAARVAQRVAVRTPKIPGAPVCFGQGSTSRTARPKAVTAARTLSSCAGRNLFRPGWLSRTVDNTGSSCTAGQSLSRSATRSA